MVSIWPWRSNESSPASFEKTLSALSDKISKTTTTLDGLKQRSRRFNVLWILYSSFAYLLYSIILILVVGWKNWGVVEIGAVIGGPILIYFIRLGLITYYNYRTSRYQARLDDLQMQRDSKIEELKHATKYNTTQELLKKYGGASAPKSKSSEASERKSKSNQNASSSHGGRTGILPPPTANISGINGQISPSSTLQKSLAKGQVQPEQPYSSTVASSSPLVESAEFAPNAFPPTPQYIQASEGSKWYDRLMDALLGEDESLPRNRIALICNQCRLVNGQAPPGVKSLEKLGKWRCGGCGTMNGEEVEVEKFVASIKEENRSQRLAAQDQLRHAVEGGTSDRNNLTTNEDDRSDITQYSESSSNENDAAHTNTEKPKAPPPLSPEASISKQRGSHSKGSKNRKR